ncbi:hypothetical protein K6U06_04035 [Acidiferrimicrobium sp. IK]|uniref:hypothetical protein n=1 Tax=Acidiferrimicrobium sp. IK TaxID=2871700 RepID=UPI0021CB623E|nr:hypothetical protein [Acidiferrimicrobium sp. IK]MCU4183519.1 hypothetical protein [Acidiferrimicrobium sp. IK]
MPGVTLDTGALIAIERGDRRMQALLDKAHQAGADLTILAGALAQYWRGSPLEHASPGSSDSTTSPSTPSTKPQRPPASSADVPAATTSSTPPTSSPPDFTRRRSSPGTPTTFGAWTRNCD